ncbi:MAG TPA: hypothetical protein VKY92_12845 [Verrucomicrobiae bacterium]|nr:hypothetical protein [Verrucomicrobiae bacterium]
MKTPVKTLALLLLSGAAACAGTFTNAFNDPNNTTGTTFGGAGTVSGSMFSPLIVSNYLVLTTNQQNLQGSVVLDDLDPGSTIGAFSVRFNLLLDSGGATPADGFAFVFGDITPGQTWDEEGPTSMNGITVSFDTYNNSAADDAPSIDVKVNGGYNNYLFHDHLDITNLMSATFSPVVITLKQNGTLSLSYKGQVIFTNLYLTGFVPASGYVFGFGARTGGLSENCYINDLSVTTSLQSALAGPTVTTAPQNVTVNEHGSATFNVGFDGTPPFTFQWYSNNVAVTDATNAFLTITNLAAAATGSTFDVGITNGQGGVLSAAAMLTVNADTNRPSLVSIVAAKDFTHLTVTFSKPVTAASSQNTANYSINGVTVMSAVQSTNNPAVVVLTTSPQKEGTPYTLTVNNVIDQSSSGNSILPNSTLAFTSPVFVVNGAGALLGTNGTSYDVGLSYSLLPDQASATTLANYTIAGATVTGITSLTNSSPGVVLQVTGLHVGSNYTVAVSGLKDNVGNTISATNLTFTVSRMQWGVVGADQLQLGNAVIPVGTNGFDVYSDGVAEWGNYDEATFVYEKITGDFDKKLRVEYQDPSSQWARAGLIARDVPNFGVDAPTQEGSQPGNTPTFPYDGKAGRYQKIHVNPVTTIMGTPGNNLWEGNRRLDTGGGCTTALTNVNSNPKYPNAWCRLQRVGQKFSIYRSDDGVNWVFLGSTTWGVDDLSKTPMPATLYVGPEYCPENGNITDASLKGVFVAKFRDYGDVAASTGAPTLSYTRTPSGLSITFNGTLQSADVVTGPWTNVPGATSPFTVTPSTPAKFFRAKQ